MKKFIILTIIISSICFYGCFSRNSEVYVPKTWKSTECIKELRNTWVVQLPNDKVNINDDVQMRALVKAVWEADKAGKTPQQIRESFEKKTVNEIINNGL